MLLQIPLGIHSNSPNLMGCLGLERGPPVCCIGDVHVLTGLPPPVYLGNKHVVGRSCVHPHPDIKMGHFHKFSLLGKCHVHDPSTPQRLYTSLMFFNDGVSDIPDLDNFPCLLLWVSHSVGKGQPQEVPTKGNSCLACQRERQWPFSGSPWALPDADHKKQKTGLLSAKNPSPSHFPRSH